MAADADAERAAGGEQARIGIFLRLRPVPRPSGRVVCSADEGWVEFAVPKDATQGLVNNSREVYRFPFDGLLSPDARQEEVFERVAAPVMRAALDGYNGTVFAFGQTGSGKTFTITGGTERYVDRGLIPRAISAMFAEAASRTGHTYTLHVSYMEIYNEVGYDLLEPAREVAALEDLPRVHIMEDEEARLHTRGLSMHRCETEEQALNMLFLGDTNRMVAETPLNQASSRSHCVFTLHVEARRGGEAVVRRSKLHFVDLAGSERVGKTGLAAHTQLKEAKYINLSLHFLEQVIISLQEGRGHVPYRNSVLTMLLRDSLGGNTRTVMVAAVSPEAQHIDESISTCRFAQRVAMISNKVEVNEELDLELIIRRLKKENALLRQELQLLRAGSSAGSNAGEIGGGTADGEGGGSGRGRATAEPQPAALSDVQQLQLQRQVQEYVEDPSSDASLDVEASMLIIRAAFDMLKGMVRAHAGSPNGQPAAAAREGHDGPGGVVGLTDETRRLRLLVQQQEQQIGVLAGVLRKQGLGSATAGTHGNSSSGSSRSGTGGPGPSSAASSRPSSTGGGIAGSRRSSSRQGEETQRQGSSGGPVAEAPPAGPYTDALLADQHKAFEYFCTTSPTHDAVAELKTVLRGKCEEACTLGARVAAAKQRVGELKAGMEQRRLARSMAALLHQQQQVAAGAAGEQDQEEGAAQEAEEHRAKALIEQEKARYREAYGQLRGLKSEIDGLQATLEHGRARLQADFHAWFAAMAGSSSSSSSRGGGNNSTGSSEVGSDMQSREAAVEGGAGHARPEPLAVAKPTAGVQQLSRGQDVKQQQREAQRDWSIPAVLGAAAAGLAARARPSSSGIATNSSSGNSHAAGKLQYEAQLGPRGAPTFSSLGGLHGPVASVTSLAVASTPRNAAAASHPATVWRQQQQQPPPQQQPGHVSPSGSQQQQQHEQQHESDPYAGVDAEVLAAARPLLTGNAQADADIIKFYEARAALLRGMVQ